MGHQNIPAADVILNVFESFGVESIFCSPGSEWPPVWEALSKRRGNYQEKPFYFNCRHEMLAVSAASGYQRSTGKLPAVLLHTTVGVLSGSMAIRTAFKEHTPMVILAGASSSFGEDSLDPGSQWLRVLADNAGPSRLVEPIVKWTGNVTSPDTLEGTLAHSLEIALTPPRGPCFVFIPFEIMLRSARTIGVRTKVVGTRYTASPEDLEKVKRLLLASRAPLIITEYAGREPKAVAMLVELAEALSVPVIESQFPEYVNFPRDHFLHQGFEPYELLAKSDLILLVGVSAPWYPPSRGPREESKVVLIDSDPDKSRMPFWNFKADITLAGSIEDTLVQLLRLVQSDARLTTHFTTLKEKSSALTSKHSLLRNGWEEEARMSSSKKPIDARWLCYLLNRVIPKDAIVVDETTSQRRWVNMLFTRTDPGTYFSGYYGGLGTGLGTALGTKVGRKESLVVALIGDGAFNYNPVLPCFGFAQEYGLPILVVIFNNGGYASQQSGVARHFPDGWSVRTGLRLGTKITPAPDYSQIARLFEGYGERVDSPSELEGTLVRALDKVRNGQTSVVDVILEESIPRNG